MRAFETHEVTNQPPGLEDDDLFSSDPVLCEAVERAGAGWARERLAAFGRRAGSAEFRELGRLANRDGPRLRTHDRFGHRIDEVEFHPAWHRIMATAMEHEVHNLPWREPRPGVFVARAALHSMLSQVESGSCCPLTMTFACRPALAHQPEVAAEWEAGLQGTTYDPRLVPIESKGALTVGMAMTEKQGGSDVRSNTTRATPLGAGGPGGDYELVGHKWFCSAPMSDGFLTLAQSARGLSCFLVRRVLPDGRRNALRIQRLKDKLGNRSNASSEIEYTGTVARMIGEEGRGVSTILEMVHHTRLDCVSGSAGLMRQALVQAVHHAAHREAFGRRLVEQPLMVNVLADLALEVEAATAMMVRLAQAFDRAGEDPAERAFARIATAVGKYWVCKRAPAMVYEAMECLGGAGYVEESILPRLYREAPVNAIWEGSGNVICLDVLRAIVREPEALPALLDELRTARGSHPAFDAHLDGLEAELARPRDAERRARRWVEAMATALQASLLIRHAPVEVADAFVAGRIAEPGRVFGTLPAGLDLGPLVARVRPA
ncbi:MAG: isovaleryl-CoA dehydrogenase [Myxococcota bacterium]